MHISIKNLLFLGKRLFYFSCFVFFVWALVKCDAYNKELERKAAYSKMAGEFRIECNNKLRGLEWVPIIGGGYLNATRLKAHARNYPDYTGECGVKINSVSFYWTGTEIISVHAWRASVPKFTQRPEEWAVIGAKYSVRFQKKNEDGTIPGWIAAKARIEARKLEPNRSPLEMIVKLERSRLELKVYKPKRKRLIGQNHLRFFKFTDWPEDEGPDRYVSCELPKNILTETREEIEALDDLKERIHCRMSKMSFRFEGGSARIRLTVESLDQLYPRLRALNQYFEASLREE